MSDKKQSTMIAISPPAPADDGSLPRIDFNALAAGLRDMDTARLMRVYCTIAELCAPDVPTPLTKH
jgi:hypothetical protein